MYETLERIYRKTKDEKYLENALKKDWLSLLQKAQIMKTE